MEILHEEKSNIDEDSGETSNRKKNNESKTAGGCHYNTYKCLRPTYQSLPFDISSLTEVSFKHIHNEGLSSHCVRLNYQPAPSNSSCKP